MGASVTCARACALLLFSLLLVGASVQAEWLDESSDAPSLRQACANAFDYGEPTCLGNSTLYWGTGNDSDLSCAHCVCGSGWGGVDCGRCLDVSVCPSTTAVDGKAVAATNCSADTLLLTEEEARSSQGKVFSCSCGGGEDGWTDFLCNQQPDTWIQWAVTGGGTAQDPAFVALKEFAGVHARTEEQWPDQFRYHYPKIFDGSAGPCKVYRDLCFPIEGTDVGDRACMIYECEDTDGRCPPEEYPMCDGFPNCVSPSGKTYETHPCTAVPQGGKSITIACQEEKVNGSYVCYYQQPGAFAPLSMTCSVGSCLYQGGAPVQPSGSKTKRVSWSIGAQSAILVSLAGVLLMTFVLFSVATDPGTAAPTSKAPTMVRSARNALPKRLQLSGGSGREEGWDDEDDLGAPLLGSGNLMLASSERNADGAAAATGAGSDRERDGGRPSEGGVRQHSDNDSVFTVSLDGAGGLVEEERDGASSLQRLQQRLASNDLRRSPAILRWTKLSYYVHGQGQSRGAEMAVLKGVSGFAGPKPPRPREAGRRGNNPSNGRDSAADGTVNFPYNYCGYREGLLDANGGGVGGTGGAAAVGASGSTMISSTLTGILGPSGAGKSSLLDVLAGRKRRGDGRTTGSVSLTFGDRGGGAGSAAGEEQGGTEAVRREGGYVSQEDVLPGTLTCYEHLMFHARLRMKSGAGFLERKARVLWVIGELGLTRVADSRIGDEMQRGLSGGERRRLSIASELVARPALLFLDEPTTGLDAATALRVMTLLRGVATGGTTVLCSLHQPRPRVLNLLDKVILLSKGRVAYFGAPGDAASYFASIDRPFPLGQPHPADAMLTLCCREDGRDLPSLFRRSAVSVSVHGEVDGENDGGSASTRMNTAAYHLEQQPLHCSLADQSPQLAGSSAGSLNGSSSVDVETELVEVGRGPGRPNGRGGGGRREFSQHRRHERRQQEGLVVGRQKGTSATAPFLVQVEALSSRLLLRAVRHPLLLVLHVGGSVAMALCLASVFGGRLGFNLAGAQDRFGLLFFLLLYLSLLSLTSLPVWREDRRLFLSEAMGGAYGHLPYFTSVALADILLIRVLPPLAFALVGYPLMGLNSSPDNQLCLLWFAGILVLSNVTVALAAMGVGALGLPLDLSNLVGGLMVLLLAAFGKFLLNGTRIPLAWRWLSSVTPLGYAFEALLINEFSDADGRRPYRIEGSHCSPDLPVIEPLGPQILSTFSFSPERSTMHFDAAVLVFLALGLSVGSLLVFFFATRTKPLVVDFVPAGRARPTFRAGNVHRGNTNTNASASSSTTRHPAAGSRKRNSELVVSTATATSFSPSVESSLERSVERREPSPERVSGNRRGPRTVSWNIPGDGAPEGREGGGNGCGDGGNRISDRGSRNGREAGATAPPPAPLLLSWEGLRYSIPVPRQGRWFARGGSSAAGDKADAAGLVVLDGVSGFAGPCESDTRAADADAESGEEGRRVLASAGDVEGGGRAGAGGGRSGTVTAIMGPSGAGKTSLLNVISGRVNAVAKPRSRRSNGRRGGVVPLGLDGAVRLNGVVVGAEEVRRVSAYVTQEDVLPETLTCYEHMMFHAHLRLRRGTSLTRRHGRVIEVLHQLGLFDIRDSRIGGGLSRGISGGEKRRLSIGTELLTRPGLLFLDEPTTGLDSSTALRVMRLVSRVASRGTTVLCSVHQPRPEVVRLLHKVILLSRGTVAFSGAPDEAAACFASIGRPFVPLPGETAAGGGGGGAEEVNPADAMLDAVGDAEAMVDRGARNDVGDEEGLLAVIPRETLVEEVHAAEASGPPPISLLDTDAKVLVRTSPPLPTQLSALLRRSALNVARDPYLAWLHIVLTLCVGLVLGSLFRDLGRLNGRTAGVQDRLGVVFLLLLYLSLLCLTSLAAWRKQMALFLHERASGAYGAAAHLTAAAALDALACRVLPPILLAVTVRPMAGLRAGSLAGLVCGLVAFNLSLAGVLAACGAGAKSSQEALATGCLVVLFSALLSGFLVAKDELPAGWSVLASLSPVGRGFEALVANELSPYGAIFRLSTKIGSVTAYTDPMTGDAVLGCFGFDGDRYYADLAVLAAVGACGLALAFVLLKRSR